MFLTKNLRQIGCLAVCFIALSTSSAQANYQNNKSDNINNLKENSTQLLAQNINPTIAGDPNLYGTWFYVETYNSYGTTGVYQEKMHFSENGELYVYDSVFQSADAGVARGDSSLIVDTGEWAVQNGQIYSRRSPDESWSLISSSYQVDGEGLLAVSADGSSQRLWTRN